MTDIRSTDFTLSSYRKPCGKNVVRGVLVSIMHSPAQGIGTRPDPNVERKILYDVSATMARLATRKETVNLEKGSTVPCGLVHQEREQHTPRSIRDDAGETVVLDHPRHVQVLDDDHLVFVNESGAELVKVVTSSICNVCMESSELHPGLVLVLRSFLLLSEAAGQDTFTSKFFGVMPGVSDFPPSTQRGKCRDPHVDAHGVLELGQGLDRTVVTQKRNVPAARCVQAHSHGRRIGPCGKRTAPSDVQGSVHLGQRELAVLEAKSALGELSRTSRVFALEAWVLRDLLEEAGVRRLKMPERLLKRDTRHFAQEGQIRGLLPQGEVVALLGVADGLFTTRPGFGTLMQGFVVDEADATECPAKQGFLLRRRVKTVAEASKHELQSRTSFCKVKPCRTIFT